MKDIVGISIIAYWRFHLSKELEINLQHYQRCESMVLKMWTKCKFPCVKQIIVT